MRLALGLQYDGSAYHGWQTQPHQDTLQDALEKAIVQFIGAPHTCLKTTTAGRTDAGVHALGQVVHFDAEVERTEWSWVRGINTYLPKQLAVQWAQVVPADFDARFSATQRHYVYALFAGPCPAPLLHRQAGYLMLPPGQRLDVQAMQAASQYLLGEHDFSSFRSAECQSHTPIKTIHDLSIHAEGPWVYFQVRGNAFLHHMVRNLVGTLLMVGQGKQSPDWVKTVLEAKSRQAAAPTFMPDGLYLAGVSYPEHYQIPKANLAASVLPAWLFAG